GEIAHQHAGAEVVVVARLVADDQLDLLALVEVRRVLGVGGEREAGESKRGNDLQDHAQATYSTSPRVRGEVERVAHLSQQTQLLSLQMTTQWHVCAPARRRPGQSSPRAPAAASAQRGRSNRRVE